LPREFPPQQFVRSFCRRCAVRREPIRGASIEQIDDLATAARAGPPLANIAAMSLLRRQQSIQATMRLARLDIR
jgi:hypothetical protein